jgi:hypothetical protein
LIFHKRRWKISMRNAIVFILVVLFVLGAGMVIGCKKKEAPTAATASTAVVAPTAAPTLAPTVAPTVAATAGTAKKPEPPKEPEKK